LSSLIVCKSCHRTLPDNVFTGVRSTAGEPGLACKAIACDPAR
jgi:hypothetical protein